MGLWSWLFGNGASDEEKDSETGGGESQASDASGGEEKKAATTEQPELADRLAVGPLLDHTATTVLVDDHPDFLRSLVMLRLPDEPSRIFAYPEKALEWLRANAPPHPLTRKWQELDLERQPRKWPEALAALRAYANDPKRFAVVSTLLSDYDMPRMNGMQLCQQAPAHIVKIMQSGMVFSDGIEQAIKAGIIRQFVPKGSGEGKLEKALAEAREVYFRQVGQPLAEALASQLAREQSALFTSGFAVWLWEHMERLAAAEMYLWDSVGSHVVVQKEGTAHALCVQNPQQAAKVVQDARSEHVPQTLRQELLDRKKMVCRVTAAGVEIPPPREWKRHAYPAVSVEGEHGTFLCCHVPKVDVLAPDRLSLHAYTEQEQL
ncbi:MAG: hypothetical protein AAF471_07285 [Myxococcota bacterium]